MSVYERFRFRGAELDRLTIAALLAAEKKWGRAFVIVQGSYNAGGVPQSAGTHDGGGAVDLVWEPDIERMNRCLRDEGCFAGWPRPKLPGEWDRHYHGILIGNERASAGAKNQVAEYRNGGDGLSGSAPDRYPYRPDPIRAFNYERAGLVSWERLNAIRDQDDHKANEPEGRDQVETVARALRGFGMEMHAHDVGKVDNALLDALFRFRRIRNIGDTLVGPFGPKVLYELCVPIRDND